MSALCQWVWNGLMWALVCSQPQPLDPPGLYQTPPWRQQQTPMDALQQMRTLQWLQQQNLQDIQPSPWP